MSEFPLRFRDQVKLCSSRRGGRYWSTNDLTTYYVKYIDDVPPKTKVELCQAIRNFIDRTHADDQTLKGRTKFNRLSKLQNIRLAPEIEGQQPWRRFRQVVQTRETEASERAHRMRRDAQKRRQESNEARAGAGHPESEFERYLPEAGVRFLELEIPRELLLEEDELTEELLQEYDQEQASMIKQVVRNLPDFPIDRIIYLIERLAPEAPLFELLQLFNNANIKFDSELETALANIRIIVEKYPDEYPEIISTVKNMDVLSEFRSAVSIGLINEGDKVVDIVNNFNRGMLSLIGLSNMTRVINKGRDLTRDVILELSSKLGIRVEKIDKTDADGNYQHPLLDLLYRRKVSWNTVKNISINSDQPVENIHELPQVALIDRFNLNEQQLNDLTERMLIWTDTNLDIFKDYNLGDAIRYLNGQLEEKYDILSMTNIFSNYANVGHAYLFREIFLRGREPETFYMEYFNELEDIGPVLERYRDRVEASGEDPFDVVIL